MIHSAVIIDGRLLQTQAWSRGMGRYLLGLMSGIAEQEKAPRVVVVFTDDLELSEEKKSVIKLACPAVELYTLPIIRGGSGPVERKNRKTLDAFVHEQGLDGALFVQTSLFTFDYSPFYPTNTINTCIFYDMIPFKFWEMFHAYFPEGEYFTRFRSLYGADKIFSISNAVKKDLVNYLGFNSDDIVNINGADIPSFLQVNDGITDQSPRDYEYIFIPGGDAPHKNMLRAIRGFDIFNANFGDSYKLVVTSFYSEDNQRRMKELSPNLELCGQVSDQELRNLYTHAKMVVFPSLDEGLGLPILEAVGFGKKVACSSIPIFEELSKDAFYLFDPYSPDSISEAMLDAIADNDEPARFQKYSAIKKKFTWARSAEVLLDSRVEKKEGQRKDSVSIIVEQDGSIGLTRQLSSIMRDLYRVANVNLFINTLREDDRHGRDAPLIFNHILPTRDIADFPKRASKSKRIFIFTAESKYSRAFLSEGDETVFLGTNLKRINSSFEKLSGSSD